MLYILMAAVLTCIFIAVIHWKMPKERAKWWALFPGWLFLCLLIYMDSYKWYYVSRFEMLAVLLFLSPLAFLASDYLQYRKDKTNPFVMRETIKMAMLSHIMMAVLALILLIYLLVQR